jgi:Glycosyltransferase family 28 C-terminal domain/Monogalactosyldiacylglycerol (MGDG) synthase
MPSADDAPEVLLLTVDAGGGHRAAANALVAAHDEKNYAWRFRVASLQEILGRFDLVRRATGFSLEESYNLLLRRRWVPLMRPLLRLLHVAIAVRRRALTRALASYLRDQPPAAIVSVVPNFNRVIRDAIRVACPGVPFFVLLTDFADFPPRFWVEPGLDRVIVATDRAFSQARAAGLHAHRIVRVSGMVLHPRFHAAADRPAARAVREELGLSPDDFTVLLLFGGKGSPEMEPLARALLDRSPAWRVIALCGQNAELLARMGPLATASGGRLRAFGFTERVADYMGLADLLVTKPGPGSLAEAFQQGLPVVVVRNRHTIPQERFNTQFVAEHDLGVVVGHWREIPDAVARLAEDRPRLAVIRAKIGALPRNRAVYEVLDLIGAEIAKTLSAG